MQVIRVLTDNVREENGGKCKCLFCENPIETKDVNLIVSDENGSRIFATCDVCSLVFMSQMQELIDNNDFVLPHLSDGLH